MKQRTLHLVMAIGCMAVIATGAQANLLVDPGFENADIDCDHSDNGGTTYTVSDANCDRWLGTSQGAPPVPTWARTNGTVGPNSLSAPEGDYCAQVQVTQNTGLGLYQLVKLPAALDTTGEEVTLAFQGTGNSGQSWESQGRVYGMNANDTFSVSAGGFISGDVLLDRVRISPRTDTAWSPASRTTDPSDPTNSPAITADYDYLLVWYKDQGSTGLEQAVDDFSLTITPEPTSIVLLGAGALGLLRRRR